MVFLWKDGDNLCERKMKGKADRDRKLFVSFFFIAFFVITLGLFYLLPGKWRVSFLLGRRASLKINLQIPKPINLWKVENGCCFCLWASAFYGSPFISLGLIFVPVSASRCRNPFWRSSWCRLDFLFICFRSFLILWIFIVEMQRQNGTSGIWLCGFPFFRSWSVDRLSGSTIFCHNYKMSVR